MGYLLRNDLAAMTRHIAGRIVTEKPRQNRGSFGRTQLQTAVLIDQSGDLVTHDGGREEGQQNGADFGRRGQERADAFEQRPGSLLQ